jgi:hypothetical protein
MCGIVGHGDTSNAGAGFRILGALRRHYETMWDHRASKSWVGGGRLDFAVSSVIKCEGSCPPVRYSMEELINRIAADAGIEPGIAEKAVGMILLFLRKEGPKDEIDALFAAVPGAAEAADEAADEKGAAAFAGSMGGGLMGLAGQLTGLGLGMGEMQTSGRDVFAYVREKAGDELVGEIVSAIPGLGQFL